MKPVLRLGLTARLNNSIQRVLFALAVVGVGLLPTSASAQPEGLVDVRAALEGRADSDTLEALAESAEPEERAQLARALSRHPELDEGNWALALAADTDLTTRSLGTLALASSNSSDAEDFLRHEMELGDDDARREEAAIAMVLRAALAMENRVDAPDDTLIAQARSHIVSQPGQAWLVAVDVFRQLIDERQRWRRLQTRLSAFETGPDHGLCARLAANNPGLVAGSDGAVPRYPDRVLVTRNADRSWRLLTGGRHAELSDRLFVRREQNSQFESYLQSANLFCSATSAVPIDPTLRDNSSDSASGGSSFSGWVGLSWRIDSAPDAFRDADLTSFFVGEDIAVSFAPMVEFALESVSGSDTTVLGSTDAGWRTGGWGLAFEAGGYLSGAFFDDRSRPFGTLRAVVDTTDDEWQPSGFRSDSTVRLSEGMGDVLFDVGRWPAPFFEVATSAAHRRSDPHIAGRIPIELLSLDLAYVEYVWDDAAAPPRDRRYLEVGADVVWEVINPTRAAFSLAVVGSGRIRSSDTVSEIAGAAANVWPQLRWRDRDLHAQIGVGIAAAAGLQPLPGQSFDDSVDLQPVGEARFVFGRSVGGFARLDFGVDLSRQAITLGRQGRVGVTERAETWIGFQFVGTRQPILLRIFGERTRSSDTGDETGRGGIEFEIALNIEDIAPSLAYVARYVGIYDEARLGDQTRTSVETLVTAGSNF